MTYLVDTDVVASYLNGRSEAIDLLESLLPAGLAISLPSYGEILDGILFAQEPRNREADFALLLDVMDIAPLTTNVMRQFASIRGQLRQQGRLIPDMDLLIAATAIEHELVLVTRNRRHFDRVPGLQLYDGP